MALSTGDVGDIELDPEPGNDAVLPFITDETFTRQLRQGMLDGFENS